MPEAMPASFACPACRAPLRLRDRRFIGATFPCPACSIELTLLALADGAATVRLASDWHESSAAAVSPSPPPRKRLQPAAKPATPVRPVAGQPRSIVGWWISPTGVVTSLSMLGIAGLLALFWSIHHQPATATTFPVAATFPVEPTAEVTPAAPSTSGPPWIAQPDDTLEVRLAKLGLRLDEYQQRHGEFPPATLEQKRINPEQRWSWLALLERDRQTASATTGLDESRPWTDPTSERFVRRQIPEFLNPQMREVIGEQDYPTAHFVGSGGIGVDGPKLPRDHPRAGLFSHQEPRRRDDVRDGLSQTIAVFGVESRWGSWAEGGPATVRPLTAEPYVRGPDGFGTGSPDSMLVLMADGSVRTVTAAADPRLVRRMAAIADGLALDANVPGEPGDRRPVPAATPASSAPRPVAQNPVDEPAVSALEVAQVGRLIPAVARPDPAVVLSQRLIRFDQTKPASRRELLYTIEDLLGRPVVWSEAELGPAAQRLTETITLQLENGTVADLLDRILANTELDFVIEAERIRLRRSKSSSLTP